MFDLKISEAELSEISQRLEKLTEQGIVATDEQSGELNMSGCASSTCMAWA